MLEKNCPEPTCQGCPNPMLNPQNTHTKRTMQKPVNAISMVLMAHFFCTTPPYKTTRPGTLINPTSVAAVSCQALSPAFNHAGYGSTPEISLRSLRSVVRVAAAPAVPC